MTEVCEADSNGIGAGNPSGNLSNRSSGVQIPLDICTRFGRYLYSKCSWIIMRLINSHKPEGLAGSHSDKTFMHQSIETPAPRPPGKSGEFNIYPVLKDG